eukprot:365800-Chlamydomonas_euryale.AAC.13
MKRSNTGGRGGAESACAYGQARCRACSRRQTGSNTIACMGQQFGNTGALKKRCTWPCFEATRHLRLARGWVQSVCTGRGGQGGGALRRRAHALWCRSRAAHHAIVDAVEAHLGSVVHDAHAGAHLQVVVTDAHHEHVRALPLAVDRQLRKHGAQLAMLRSAADPRLARLVHRRVHDEFLAHGVVRCGCLDTHHIGAVACTYKHRGT